MTVLEKINEINEALKEIFDFTQTNETIKSDFTEYLSTIGARNISLNQMEKIFLPYVFERRINGKSILEMYTEEKGAKDIIEKFGGEVPENYDDLWSLAGVGRKTANVVSAVAFKKPAIAVDTHVFRVSNRLGLAKGKTPLAVETGLNKVIKEDLRGDFHHYLILYGREVCSARKPLCDSCKINDCCEYYNENKKKK